MAQGEVIEPMDLSLGDEPEPTPAELDIDLSRPFRELKKEMVNTFERRYTIALLREHQGNVAAAARAAGLDRKNLWSLAKKHEVNVDAIRDELSDS